MTERKLAGSAWDADVAEIEGQLTYTIPVESGFQSRLFAFAISAADLTVLQTDTYRRAALQIVAQDVLQDAWGRKNEEAQTAFDQLAADVLHSPVSDLAENISRIGQLRHANFGIMISQKLAQPGWQ